MEGQEMGVKALLHLAQQAGKNGDHKAESLYERALKQAEIVYGPDDAGVGVVLLDMIDFYEGRGDMQQAHQLMDRVRGILSKYAQELVGEPVKRDIT